MRTLLVLILSSFTLQASADPIKILGRGVQDRKTGDSIALSCIGYASNGSDETCQGVQFVKFPAGHPEAMEYLGRPIYFKDGTTESEQLKIIKTRIKSSLKREGKTAFGLASMGLMIVAGGTLTVVFGAGIFALGGVAAWAVCATAQCDPAIFDPTTKIANAFSATDGIKDAVSNRDGWSWSANPRKIGHKNFQRFEASVR